MYGQRKSKYNMIQHLTNANKLTFRKSTTLKLMGDIFLQGGKFQIPTTKVQQIMNSFSIQHREPKMGRK